MNQTKSASQLSRRDFLWRTGGGLGGIAFAKIFLEQEALAITPHHAPRAKSVIQLFLNGGMSQMDTFDYKPELEKRHGQSVDVGLKATATGTPGPLMKSPFAWKQHGQCGRWVTDVFPHLAGSVDDLAFLMAMRSKSNVHGPPASFQTTAS